MAASLAVITGRPVNGVLLLLVALGLAWDAARNPHRAAESARGEAWSRTTPAISAHGKSDSGPRVPRRRRPIIVAVVAGGAAYAYVVGTFTRYSWPATAGVIGLAVVMVALGWRGPLRPRPDPGRLPTVGAVLWACLLLAAGIWELTALFLQPSLTIMSYAHPTISELASPLLATHSGRSVAVGLWVAIGGYLAQR